MEGPEPGAASLRDLIVVVAGTLLFFAASAALELNETMLSWTRQWERYQLDEIPGVLLFLATALAWFAWRRMQEARAARNRLAEALAENRRLSLSHVRVQEEERKDLARELHDELSQHLNALKINAVSIRGRTQGTLAEVHDASLAIIEAVDHVHGTIRDMLRRLRPVGLDELGLAAALEHLVSGWRSRNPGVEAGLYIDANVGDANLESLRENESIAIYRLVQEGLNNVARHARARSVTIRLAGANGAIVLSIADDGIGARGWDDAPGLGLIGMRERIEALHGRLAIESGSGRGFRIEATVPHPVAGDRA